ncbi:hypothetical protein PseAD21_02080 [Pseudomonas sp. AD21]|nr:hypothetical protein PseAD21_02080 [Pseudomonas sp. AD21]
MVGFLLPFRKVLCLGWPYREQAHSYIWNAFPCRSEPARDEALKITTITGSILRSIIAQNPLSPIETAPTHAAPFVPQNQ